MEQETISQTKIKAIQGFECRICDKLHKTIEEVSKCCIREKQGGISVYECPKCKDLHDNEEDVLNCCDVEDSGNGWF